MLPRAITRVVPSSRRDSTRNQHISATPRRERIATLDSIETDMGPHDFDSAECAAIIPDRKRARKRLIIELKGLGHYGNTKACPLTQATFTRQTSRGTTGASY